MAELTKTQAVAREEYPLEPPWIDYGNKEEGVFQRAAIVCFTQRKGTKMATQDPEEHMPPPQSKCNQLTHCKLSPCFQKIPDC